MVPPEMIFEVRLTRLEWTKIILLLSGKIHTHPVEDELLAEEIRKQLAEQGKRRG